MFVLQINKYLKIIHNDGEAYIYLHGYDYEHYENIDSIFSMKTTYKPILVYDKYGFYSKAVEERFRYIIQKRIELIEKKDEYNFEYYQNETMHDKGALKNFDDISEIYKIELQEIIFYDDT